MKEKRRDNKGRILHTGESQRTDGKYLYKYVDAFRNIKYVYAWRLTPTDPTPKGKREKPSLRELEQQIRRDIEDGIDSTGKQEHEPERFTVYHGTFKHQYHNELVRSCVHRYRKIRGLASNRIEVFTTILTTIDSENIRR